MSTLKGIEIDEWIEDNHPKNGLFRAYWVGWTAGSTGITLDPEGGRLRYEWEYKDGKRADGINTGSPGGEAHTTRG